MASPTPYALTYDFQAFQTGSPTTPLPADRLEIEFGNLQTTTDEIISNLDLIQRSDGALANNSVGVDQLKPEVTLTINPTGNWVTLTAYVVNDAVYQNNNIYRCIESHTSGTFSTDLGNSKWELHLDMAQFLTAASNSATAAQTAQTAAETAETNAETAEANAAASATAAATSETNAAASEAAAAASAAEGMYNDVITLTNADSPYVPTAGQEGTLFRLDTTSGDIDINLSALSVYAEDMKFSFVKVDASANQGNVNRGGTDTLNGGTALTLDIQYETHSIVGDSATGTWIDIVHTTGVPDGSITEPKLATGAVTVNKLGAGAVTEAKMTLADNTTNDFSTSAHGFVPKGPNDGKQLFDDGTWKYDYLRQASKSANYTLDIDDANSHIFHPSSDANDRTFTIPANASVAYPTGTVITFINQSANDVDIAITTDTLTWAGDGSTGTRTLAQHGVATAIKVDSTNWYLTGTGIS